MTDDQFAKSCGFTLEDAPVMASQDTCTALSKLADAWIEADRWAGRCALALIACSALFVVAAIGWALWWLKP